MYFLLHIYTATEHPLSVVNVTCSRTDVAQFLVCACVLGIFFSMDTKAILEFYRVEKNIQAMDKTLLNYLPKKLFDEVESGQIDLCWEFLNEENRKLLEDYRICYEHIPPALGDTGDGPIPTKNRCHTCISKKCSETSV